MTAEERNKLANLKWGDIDQDSAVGQLLCSAVCILGWAKFPDKKPHEILDFVKDVYLHPFVNEPSEATFRRLLEERQKKNN